MPSLSERYRWLDDALDIDWSVAVINGRTLDEVVATYGGDVSKPLGPMDYASAKTWRNQHFDDGGIICVRQLPGAVLVIEPNGWASSIAEIARRQSANGGHFFSVYWSPSAFQVLAANDGTVSALFDPVYLEPADDQPRSGEVYPAWLTGSEFLDDRHIRSTCITLLEEHTGVQIERTWLGEPHATYSIPDPDDLLRGIADVRLP
ncbi:hypothetical protein [Actinokineospora sp. NBRC 105648]|uniref:hypothetical protein n=1 Tax=Actinokineospora sp. NBRC 105648 TaxID=3032206 RepID=UPI0024A08176|nr:hypothetical protein [Actinokineospora sp. NBRC 105648]GLZ38619.1 hypothetical protein Acsp05_22430 [Actinokineospora sp. NBRC 105648]